MTRIQVTQEEPYFIATDVNTGKVLFGGIDDCGGIDGYNPSDVINAAIDYLKDGGQLYVPFSLTIKSGNK